MKSAEIEEFLTLPKEQRLAFIRGVKLFIDWNEDKQDVDYYRFDTGKVLNSENEIDFCGFCKMKFVAVKDKNGELTTPDPCLGLLPGVYAGCCGHGDEEGYLYFENGTVIRFEKKLETEFLDARV